MKNKTIGFLSIPLVVFAIGIASIMFPCERGNRFFRGTDTFVGVGTSQPEISNTDAYLYIRNFSFQSRFATNDARVTGNLTFTLNTNFNMLKNNTGPAWGTFKIEVDNNVGEWEGVCTGERIYSGIKNGLPTWLGNFSCTAYGKGPGLEEHKLVLNEVVTTHDPMPMYFTGKVDGMVLEPRNTD